MINLVKNKPVKETIVLSDEELMEQAHLKAYINDITIELKKAHNKEELIDMLKWFYNKANEL
jgi:hypothetical protein